MLLYRPLSRCELLLLITIEKRLGTHIQWRHTDFEKGTVERCYVIYDGKAVLITKKEIMEKTVEESLKKLKP